VSTAKYRFAVVGATTDGCTAARASQPTRRLIRVDFTNKSTTRLTVDWLDYDGVRQQFFTLSPGETRAVNAYVGDAWLVADRHGCVGTFTNTQSSHITVEP
jgi:hypothetical protein